jgi:3-hydroxybutyryl-CoA dehydrogenase
MKIQKVFVAGSGTMGRGIAQACAQAGLAVIINDISQAALDVAVKQISWSAGKLIEKGKVSGTLDELMARVSTSITLKPAAECDMVVEAIFEDVAVKRVFFTDLDKVVGISCLVASNTSAIPITELASFMSAPQRFLGLHFFNPVPMMAAVEVIKGTQTSDETFRAGRDFALAIGKEPILVHRDVPGFVLNRINLPSNVEAMRLVEEGIATVEDIDKGVRLAFGRRMGIFETGDIVGLDITHGALLALYEETKDMRWFPPMILRRKVKAGQLGRKTGKGWYVYDDEGDRLGPA